MFFCEFCEVSKNTFYRTSLGDCFWEQNFSFLKIQILLKVINKAVEFLKYPKKKFKIQKIRFHENFCDLNYFIGSKGKVFYVAKKETEMCNSSLFNSLPVFYFTETFCTPPFFPVITETFKRRE